ncbi:MAG TPA: putative Ig domain-containing protein [Gammaproteobacteria bacterium]
MRICVRRARLSLLLTASVILAACGGDDGGGATAADGTTDPGTANPPTAGSPSGGSAQGPSTAAPGTGTSNPGGVKNSVPTIAGTPQTTVLQETPYVFVPEASDADGDILHFSVTNPPPWAKFEPTTGRLQGTPSAADVGTYANIKISVTDGAADASLKPFSITVTSVADGAVELTWTAPTQNVDGSALTDLAGYKIYWGTQPGEFPNSVTIDNPGVVTYVLENLVPATYYFVATAFNSEGAESDPSDMTSVTIS